MRCPFLNEAEVKYCGGSAFRKLIPRKENNGTDEKCSSSAYVDCAVYRERAHDTAPASICPFLERQLAQFCGASPVTKFIPYSESSLSRCGTEGYRYCEVYLAISDPARGKLSSESRQWVDGVRVPEWLYYTPNHMWLDPGTDGVFHIGIDAFLARALGEVEKITFVSPKGVQRPTAVLTVRGVDVQVIFPTPVRVTSSNVYLRANPSRLTSDPYGNGWLFEGNEPADDMRPLCHGLLHGAEALEWMQDEIDRLSRYVHEEIASSQPGCEQLAGDGGAFSDGFIRHLGRDEMLNLFNEFFSPYASWRDNS
jgi:glycine cleavage system H protein